MAWVLSCRLGLLPLGGQGGGWIERAHVTDNLIGADKKVLDYLIKITFLVQVETAVSLGIKSRLGIMVFSISDAFLGLWFFSLTREKYK